MKRKSFLGKLSLIALFALATQSCKKENGIDNNNVIERPYVVYAADANGNILKTNDGTNYKTIFPGAGSPLRAMSTSKDNLLIVKNSTFFVSDNEGKSFNPLKTAVVDVPLGIKWPFFLLDIPSINRVYVSNSSAIGQVSVSFWDNGKSFDSDTTKRLLDTPSTTESFTYLDNQSLYTYSVSGSVYGVSKLFYKTGKDEPWQPVVTDLISPYNFYLSHSGNTLIATDYDGVKGSWYSLDFGKTFKQYAGLPVGKILYTTYAAYDRIIIGAEDGVYVYDNSSKFSASNSGLDANTKVYSVVGKDNLYKNNVSKKFFYIATSTGIYRSEDLAKSWVKVKSGDYRLLY